MASAYRDTSISPELERKYHAAKEWLAAKGAVAVAFSAGVDSTLLLTLAHEVLGSAALAITATSPAHPARETQEARAFCEERGIRQIVFESDEMSIPGFDRNPENRCYLCKTRLFEAIVRIAEEEGMHCVAEGTNTDDMGDYRPGFAALGELGVESPLLETGFSKQDIRDLSAALGLATARKQSFACLYTRLAYGDLITPEKLARIDAAEQWLLDAGYRTVRVRMVGDDTARIELADADLPTALAQRADIVGALKAVGFSYVALDLQGYRTGSGNETLRQ